MSRRRRRCRTCTAPIAFFGSPFTTGLRPFNPRPADPSVQGTYPVFGRKAYRFADLVEVIQVQRECSTGEAEAEVRDLPWHTLHACPTDDDPTDTSTTGKEADQ